MKIRVENYTFDASARTITFEDYDVVELVNLLIITNVTDNILVYNFADTTKGGTVNANILTLAYDTSGMDDSDKLQIFYDDPEVNLPTGNSEIIEGNVNKVHTIDLKSRNIFELILLELQKINIQLAEITGDEI